MTDVKAKPDTLSLDAYLPEPRAERLAACADIGRLWRSQAPDQVGTETLCDLRERFALTEILREPRWRAAAQGDVASAAAIAIDLLFAGEISTSRVDLVMSCLLVMAAGGSSAAAMLLRHAQELDRNAANAC